MLWTLQDYKDGEAYVRNHIIAMSCEVNSDSNNQAYIWTRACIRAWQNFWGVNVVIKNM